MKTKLKMPKISDTANEMVVVEVLVSVGEQIRKDQVLFTVETDKSVVEIPSPFDGTIFSHCNRNSLGNDLPLLQSKAT